MGPIHEDGWDLLKNNNFDVFEITDFTEQSLITNLKEVDGIALRTAKLSKTILQECKKLKIVSRHGVGYDNVDLEYLNLNKQALAITGTANAISVAEHVMTMFLYLTKKINLSNDLVKNNKFTEKRSLPDFFEIYKKNILIMGFGRIGQAVAKRCLGFESNVYVYDPFIDKKSIEEKNCYKIDFDEGIAKADFITIHMPLNQKTKNLISKKEFKSIKNECIIINTARGGIINENDLIWALTNKEIFGAGLDVFEKEPPEENNPLFKFENVILTPHNAALTLECRKRMAVEVCQNINFFFNDISQINMANIVNRKNINL